MSRIEECNQRVIELLNFAKQNTTEVIDKCVSENIPKSYTLHDLYKLVEISALADISQSLAIIADKMSESTEG